MTPEKQKRLDTISGYFRYGTSTGHEEWLIIELRSAWSKLEKARGGIIAARNELGVPQPNYPAPVYNAAMFLRDTLKELEET